MAIKIESCDGGVRVLVKVVPGSSRDRIVGELGNELKVAVSSPPQDGAANRAVIELLAEHLGLARNQIQIVRGHGNPHKEIFVRGLTVEALRAQLG